MVLGPASGSSCLGSALRESGQSREPAPPDRITGTIDPFFFTIGKLPVVNIWPLRSIQKITHS